MPPTKTWKGRERTVNTYFGGRGRTPLSGGASKHTRGDIIHPKLFVENKLRRKHSTVKLWDQVDKLAALENKFPIVTLCEHNRPGFWIVIHSNDAEYKDDIGLVFKYREIKGEIK